MGDMPLTGRQERRKQVRKTVFHVFAWLAGLAVAAALGVLSVVFFGVQTVIIDQSMNPLLKNEDVVLTNTVAYKAGHPKRMDLAAVKIGMSESSPTYVRRIAGLPGETVRISDGILYIDDEETEISFSEEKIRDSGAASGDGILLGEDEYFVLCEDYNNYRDDSRMDSFGIVKSSQITGKVWLIISPLSRFGPVR